MLRRSFLSGVLLIGLLTAPTLALAQSAGGWTTFTDDRGTQVEYPSYVFSNSSRSPKGRTFSTHDGRASIDVYTSSNEQGERPAHLLRRMFPQPRSRLSYERVTNNFFAVSAAQNNRVLYQRCNFHGSTLHCFDLTYPLAEKRQWDATVTRISRSLRRI